MTGLKDNNVTTGRPVPDHCGRTFHHVEHTWTTKWEDKPRELTCNGDPRLKRSLPLEEIWWREVSLPVRAYNALQRSGVETVGDFFDLNLHEWGEQTRNVGARTVTALQGVQSDLYREWKQAKQNRKARKEWQAYRLLAKLQKTDTGACSSGQSPEDGATGATPSPMSAASPEPSSPDSSAPRTSARSSSSRPGPSAGSTDKHDTAAHVLAGGFGVHAAGCPRCVHEAAGSTEEFAHDSYTHASDGRVCILLEFGWFVPLDAGGEGFDCERPHGRRSEA